MELDNYFKLKSQYSEELQIYNVINFDWVCVFPWTFWLSLVGIRCIFLGYVLSTAIFAAFGYLHSVLLHMILSICCALVNHVPLQVLFILRGGPCDFWRGEWVIWYHDCFYALEDFFLGMCVCMFFWLTDHERAVVECTWVFWVQDSL